MAVSNKYANRGGLFKGAVAVGTAVAKAALLRARERKVGQPARLAGQRGTPGGASGRDARRPADIGKSGWKDVLWRTYSEFSNNRVLLVAAGITFYGLLALFPALTALVSMAGLIVDPNSIVEQLRGLSGIVPEGALQIVGDQMKRIASQPSNHLSIAFVTGLAVALWSANNGIKAMFEGLNVVYGEQESRSFVRLNLVSLVFTFGAIVMVLLALAAIVVVPVILGYVGLAGFSQVLVDFGRWPLLFALIIVGITLLYRFGPSRRPAKWRWLSVGSVVAAALWVLASGLFSWYVANFGSYNVTYGSLGAMIGFMIWIWISAAIVLLGAQLNGELERQTFRDTTTSGDQPIGSRGAKAADSVGRSQG
jgi:membrane protein